MPLWGENTYPAVASTNKPKWLQPDHLGTQFRKYPKGQNASNTFGVSTAMTANNAGKNYTPGWNYVRVGTGPVLSVTVTNLTNGGFTVNTNVSVVFSGGGGVNANGIAQFTAGNLSSILVDNGGVGYNSAPTVTITGGNGNTSAAQLVAVMGGRCGRKQVETLVVITNPNFTANDAGNTTVLFGS